MLILIFGIFMALAPPVSLGSSAAKLEGLFLNANQIATLENELRESPVHNLLDLAHAYQWGEDGRIKQHGFAAVLLQQFLDSTSKTPQHMDAQFELGWMYRYGLGVSRNDRLAEARFRLAAAAGHLQAQIELGWLHLLGQGTSRNPGLALSRFQAAAESGSSQAQWLIAHLTNPASPQPPVHGDTIIEPLTGMPFRQIPAGHFLRQSVDAPNQASFPTHRATLTKAFFMAAFEVTQAQWRRIMGGQVPYDAGCEDCPVVGINWYQAQAFIERLNLLSPIKGFRLPSEAEWEYACRAGTTTAFHFGQVLGHDQANVDFRFDDGGEDGAKFVGRPEPVGHYPANAWGLHDMHGNVLEWCQDDFCELAGWPLTDPMITCQSGLKVIRGGSWFFGPRVAMSGYRDFHCPQDLGRSLGLRLVKDTDAKAP